MPATLGLLEAGAAQRVANTSLNMPLDLPDGSFEVVDAFPGLRFSNPVAMVSLPGNDSLLFVVEKPGRIRKVHLSPSPSMETFQGKSLQPQKIRTEFWAIGLRNPWRKSFDSITGDLYVGDVGQNRVEEVDVIRKGGNYGWNYREGTLSGPKTSLAPQGWEDLPPILEYRHGSRSNQGNSITGGLVYRGSRYTSLYGAYVFADYVSGHIWAMRHNGQTHTRWWNLARDAGISAFGMDPTTEHILMTDHGSGRVLLLVEKPDAEAIALPATLSETGVFRELATLTPHEGIEPYEINVPFWSDHAQKKRWFSLPELTQKITPFSSSMWHFPSGAVWIKHFELDLVRGDPSTLHRLETRLLVRNDA